MSSFGGTELSLPAQVNMQPLVHNFVLALGELAGMAREEAESLAQVVWQACLNASQYAYEAGEHGALKIVVEITPAALTVGVHDRGLPYYYALAAPEQQNDTARPSPLPGPDGLPACQNGADETRWINHGKAGNEIRLTKHLNGLCHLDNQDMAVSKGTTANTGVEGEEGYTIRLLRPADAVQIARLMYRVYGYSYSNTDFYYPDRLTHNLETGRHVGVVALTGAGEIVGHVGIERQEKTDLAELGQLAVAPTHRGRGLRARLGDYLDQEIKHLGLVGLFAEAVTVHTISQEASEHRSLSVAGIKLMDWQADFKKLHILNEKPAGRDKPPTIGHKRETMVLYFKYLAPLKPKEIYAPPWHREMIAKIYRNLGIPITFLESGNSGGHGQLALHYEKNVRVGHIFVNQIGSDSLSGISQAYRDLERMTKAAVVGLYLPLAQKGTPELCQAAEKLGFFFSGVQPQLAPDGDFLRLQRLQMPLDLNRVHLASATARELLDYVLAERQRLQ